MGAIEPKKKPPSSLFTSSILIATLWQEALLKLIFSLSLPLHQFLGLDVLLDRLSDFRKVNGPSLIPCLLEATFRVECADW